jgi:hypothetical protein
MLLNCASFRWPVIVMRKLRKEKKKRERKLRDVTVGLGISLTRVREKTKRKDGGVDAVTRVLCLTP